jgi:hypothetical protein
VVRRNVYHPAFGGSFSLKRVVPAILPDMSYDDLEVAEGIQAGIVWGRLVDPARCAEENPSSSGNSCSTAGETRLLSLVSWRRLEYEKVPSDTLSRRPQHGWLE